MESDRDERIRRRAYEIWEREGQPAGREAEHWEKAAREIEQEEGEQEEAKGDPQPKKPRAPRKGGAAGLSSGLQSGGTIPGTTPATTEGSIGTGGASTKGRNSGTAKRTKKKI